MKLGIFSDLHMEFEPWLFEPEDDVMYINAGDTHPKKLFVDYFENLFTNDNYFAVKGNHDYYGHSFSENDFHSKIVSGIKIAGAPLWTDLSNGLDWANYWNNLVDSRFIDDLTFDDYMAAHRKQKEFLLTSGADVIVSHHAPSYLSVSEQYKGNSLNPCFMTELFNDIVSMPKPPKLWIHGHVHNRCDYMIGNTRVICHPRGYPDENVWYKNYEPLIVEI